MAKYCGCPLWMAPYSYSLSHIISYIVVKFIKFKINLLKHCIHYFIIGNEIIVLFTDER